MPYTPPTASVVVLNPRIQGVDQNEPSYIDLAFTSSSIYNPPNANGFTVYDAWCLDTTLGVSPSTSYTASLYSSYELSILQASPLSQNNFVLNYLQNLDNINYLLNFYTGTGYTYGEVQTAIWQLIGQTPSASEIPALGTVDPAQVTSLVNLALANGDGYVPQAGQAIGVIADLVSANGAQAQPLIFETKAAALGDFVFEDKNANGVQDAGETGIAGVQVQLVRDLNKDGTITPDEILKTGQTDINGIYNFTGLTPGLDYQVVFVQPSSQGYDGVSPRQVTGSATAGNDSDGLLTNVVQLAPAETNLSLDAGFYKTAALGDRVWYDVNGNGIQDSTEAGANGVLVTLLNAQGNPVASQVTADDGNYLFTNLIPGAYSVQFGLPTGYTFTGKDANNNNSDGVDSDADATGKTGSYTLNSGDRNTTVDAGLVSVKARIGDFIFEDKNANGVQDAGEGGVAGAVVTLLDANGNPLTSVTTTSTGAYGFDVAPGTYSIQVSAPTGYVITSRDVGGNTAASDAVDSDIDPTTGKTINYTLTNGQVNNTVDGGLYRLAQLGDRVWFDNNSNGVQDNGETGANGVLVTLLNAAGAPVASQLTVTDGNYLFSNLVPGSYSVQFGLPDGYIFTGKDANNNGSDGIDSDADTVTGRTGSYTLNSGDSNLTVDAGLIKKAKIGDFVFEDKNGNGIQDTGEAGIPGAIVTLCDANGNPLTSVSTGSDGKYSFDVAPGTYSVKFTAPNGFIGTAKDANNNGSDATDSDADPITGKTGNYTVGNGEVNNTIDAGFYKAAALGDRVWFDTNGNGIQDTGEASVPNVVVTLLNATGGVVASQLTNATGNYLFTNLAPGSYSVQFAAPSGFVFTTRDANGNTQDSSDSDVDATGRTGIITLASGETNTTVDAGLVAAQARLGDRVFLDANANGVQDSGEVGISGVTVSLKNAAGTIIASTTTDASGIYGFNVNPGTYSVQFATPVGYNITTRDAGGNTATSDTTDSDIDSTGNTIQYTVAAGQTNNTIDAGYFQHAKLGDRVWYDKNANGIQDAGESSIANVSVELRDSATGSLVATTKTDASGIYSFSVRPGNYFLDFVEQSLPSGFIWTKPNQGTNDALDSDVQVRGNNPLQLGQTADIVLKSGQTDLTWDAGAYKVGIDVEKYVSGTRTVTTCATGTEGADCKYWKDNCSGGINWSGLNCKGTDTFGAIFGVTCAGSTKSLYSILCGTSTATYDLWQRECVSAYLNACHDKVDYAFSKDQVCAQVQSSLSTASYSHTYNLFCNENTKGCNWTDTKCTTTCTVDTALYDADAPPGLEVKAGSIVTFTYCVKNTGDTPLSNITLTDDRIQNVTFVSGDTNNNGLLDLTETWTYKATEVAQSGTVKNIGTVVGTDSAGGVAKVTDSDPAYYTGTGAQKSSIGDRVWFDKDGDGIQETGEVGVGGVKVTLKGAGKDGIFGNTDDITATTTTDANGKYLFSSIDAGKYQVVFDGAKDGYVLTRQNQGSNDATDSDADSTGTTGVITLAAGEQNLSVDAGLVKPCGELGDRLWIDTDGDGVQETGEVGLGGINIVLKGAGRDNIFGTADDITASTITSATGAYLFDKLDAGKYVVDFSDALAKGWRITKQNVGSDGALNSDARQSDGKTDVLDLAADQQRLTIDAGVYKVSTTGVISGFTSNDLNNDGKRNGDPAISGVTITLTGTDITGKAVTATCITDSSGFYKFSNLVAGTYVVTETQPSDWVDGKDKAGSLGSSVIGNDKIQVVLPDGGISVENNFFEYRTACVGDKVWADTNHNGLQDLGEAGICNIKVQLLDAVGAVVATTTTNLSGNYQFTGVVPGTYSLQFDKTNVIYSGFNLNTWKWGVKNVGTNDAIDSDVNGDGVSTVNVTKTDAFDLTSGQNDTSRDAALTPLVINLDGKGVHTVSLADSGGTFDLFGNGTAINSGWIASGSGFLAIDKNGNGSIDSINELFGGTAKGSGYAALSAYDSNGDGVVDAADKAFDQLLIWQDLNGDHVSSADELMSLAQAGIASLSLAATDLQFHDAMGNVHGDASQVTMTSGAKLDMVDVYFGVSADDAAAAGVTLPSVADLLGSTTLDSLIGPAAPMSTTVAAAQLSCDTVDTSDLVRRLAEVKECHTAATV